MVSERAIAAAVAVVGLGCSLPLYATTIFEHTPGVALLLAAIDTILGGPIRARRSWLGGVLFGIATCFRTELYAFAPSMAVIVAWRIGLRRPAWLHWLAFGGGSLAVIAAFLAVGVRRVLSLRGPAPPPTGHIRLRPLPQTIIDDPRIRPRVYELTGDLASSSAASHAMPANTAVVRSPREGDVRAEPAPARRSQLATGL
jgi:hypothetical protein